MVPLLVAVGLAASASANAADYVSMSGKDLYGRFCVSCHGASGHGDGSVARTLTVEVPDLSLLARRAGGAFPREKVVHIIDGRYTITAHGSRTMPVWGEDLSRLEIGNPDAERVTRTIIDR